MVRRLQLVRNVLSGRQRRWNLRARGRNRLPGRKLPAVVHSQRQLTERTERLVEAPDAGPPLVQERCPAPWLRLDPSSPLPEGGTGFAVQALRCRGDRNLRAGVRRRGN